jgi:hypothetical protein
MSDTTTRAAMLVALSVLTGLAGDAKTQTPAPSTDPPSRSLRLVKQSFQFPGDGEQNNNRRIGDFCCTGETATVRAESGVSLGYIYFYDFPGGGTRLGDGVHSAARRFSVLVSGISDFSRLESPRAKSSIVFDAGEMQVGSQKRTNAGALQFTVTMEAVRLDHSSGEKYLMDSVRCKVDVQTVP